MYQAGDPIIIGTKTAKNRLTMAPTVKFYAEKDGMVTEDFVTHYEERAKHGVGFICVEATCVDPSARLAPSQLGLWCDEQIEGHRRIVDTCHKYGALIVPQLHFGGLGTHPECGPLTAPSAITWNTFRGEQVAKELSKEDIARVIEAFVNAALRAQKAGYDGVQLHACHGYLINNFASHVNMRTDEYGGNTANRARFGCEIIAGIKKDCGDDFIVSARISGYDPTVEDSIETGELYVAAGCDFLQVSCGVKMLDDLEHDDSLPYNKIAGLGVRFHEHFKGRVPVSLVNGMRNVEVVRYMFEHELVDAVDLGCGLLADPAFSEAILDGADYQPCRGCPNGCAFGPVHTHHCPATVLRGGVEFPNCHEREQDVSIGKDIS